MRSESLKTPDRRPFCVVIAGRTSFSGGSALQGHFSFCRHLSQSLDTDRGPRARLRIEYRVLLAGKLHLDRRKHKADDISRWRRDGPPNTIQRHLCRGDAREPTSRLWTRELVCMSRKPADDCRIRRKSLSAVLRPGLPVITMRSINCCGRSRRLSS